jgi:hypothetical protein
MVGQAGAAVGTQVVLAVRQLFHMTAAVEAVRLLARV